MKFMKSSAFLEERRLLFVGATESIYNYKDFGFAKHQLLFIKAIR